MLEDLGLLVFRQVLEDRHRVVGFDLAHAFRHFLRRQVLEDFLAHRVIHLGERGEIEVDAEQFDETRAALGFERLQHGTEIGLMQVADQAAQGRNVGGVDRTGNLTHESNPDRAVLGAQRRCADYMLGHAGLGRGCFKRAACTPAPWEWAID